MPNSSLKYFYFRSKGCVNFKQQCSECLHTNLLLNHYFIDRTILLNHPVFTPCTRRWALRTICLKRTETEQVRLNYWRILTDNTCLTRTKMSGSNPKIRHKLSPLTQRVLVKSIRGMI